MDMQTIQVSEIILNLQTILEGMGQLDTPLEEFSLKKVVYE